MNETGFAPVKTLAFVAGVTKTYAPYKNRDHCIETSKEKKWREGNKEERGREEKKV